MSSISWLHISDLHIFLNDPSWEDFQKFLQEYLCTNHKPNFVVITGDYRNIWAHESYEKAASFIHRLMHLLNLKPSKDLFLIPGNHDSLPQNKKQITTGKFFLKKTVQVDDDPRTHELQKLMPPGLSPWEGVSNTTDWLDKHKSEPKNYIDRLCGVRRNNAEDENIVDFTPLLSGFFEYSVFVKSIIPYYAESNLSPVVPHLRIWENEDGLGLNIVHLNTALAADGGRGHYQAVDLIATKKMLNGIRTGLPTIILAHNSFYDLHPEIQKQLIPSLWTANACAWLSGDEHRFDIGKTIPRIPPDTGKPIPILICGKSAPDHRDDYSENGFIYYTYDGAQINAQRLNWPFSGTHATEEINIAVSLSQHVPWRNEATRKKRMMIGYLSCNPSTAFKQKYHLGHAYFIKNIDKILANRDYAFIMTSSFLFAHNRSRDSHRADQRYSSNMIQMWKDCFDGRVEVLDIKENFQQQIPLDERASNLSRYVSDMELLMEVNERCNDVVYDWFHTGTIEEYDYNLLKDCFRVSHGSSIEKAELLSFIYLLHKRPVWYSGPWLVNFIDFWDRSIYYLIRERLKIDVSANDIYIVEASRNHYVWDAISYCAKRFSYGNFPKVEYIDSLLDTDCQQPMKSSNSQKALFLADHCCDTVFTDEFRDHVKHFFETDKEPNEVAAEYYKRLFRE